MKPNVLILLSDQQRYDTVHAVGYSHMITPNLDKLTEEGCYFPNAYSANPVCMPARHDIITGLPARYHGYYANSETRSIQDYSLPTLPRIFSRHGYRTVSVGKMHFSPAREHHGFSEMFAMEEIPKRRNDDQYALFLKENGLEDVQNLHGVRPYLYHTPQNAQTSEQYHGSTWVANQAIDWLTQNGDEPFFMMCGFIQPHPPWNNPKEFDGIYKNKEMPAILPRSRSAVDFTEESEWFGDFDSPEQRRKTQEAYYTAVTMVDKNVGRIIEHLRQTNQLDNTLVIYTTDHGEMLYDKGYFSKSLGYDSAAKIPFILRYPEKISANSTDTRFIDLLDIMPTCLDFCGLPYPRDDIQPYGESLLNGSSRNRDTIISASGEDDRRWVMVRNKRYKYIYNYNGGIEEFYDMTKPDAEAHNLFGTDEMPQEIHHALRQQALAYETNYGPLYCVKDGNFVPTAFKKLTPDVRGKFHFWSNAQTQKFFFEKDKAKRAKILKDEIAQAIANHEKSQTTIDTLFDNNEWFANFASHYHAFTGSTITKENFYQEILEKVVNLQ